MAKIFRSYHGRHFLSRYALKIFDRTKIRRHLGLLLVLSISLLSLINIQALAFVDTVQLAAVTPMENPPVETKTKLSFQLPLTNFSVSQGFSLLHWGADFAADEGTTVSAVAKGKIVETGASSWGYGNHVIIEHPNNQKSLYAHLSKIEVKTGDQIDQGTIIGRIGHTGWATGNHLHLEIYQNGLPFNPLEVLPEK